MEKYIPLLKNTKLFAGVGDEDIGEMGNLFPMMSRNYKKNEYVFHAGEQIRSIALLAEGALLIQKDDYWGNRSIINRVNVGEIFGEAYAMPGSEAMLNEVIAQEDSTVLFFEVQRILSPCANASPVHLLVIQNLLRIIAARNRFLVQKIDIMAQRTTREKLTAYLSAQSQRAKSPIFDIPLNRQQLADFLAVDRSAMSNELCKMRDDGMLKFERNHFELMQKNKS